MANHKSALKRIRSNSIKRLRNRYQHKTTRTWLKRMRQCATRSEGTKLLSETFSMLDKMVKKHIIHKNKAANLKSSLAKHLNTLS
jgi:small subunit ribosomal protein S20